MGIFGQYRACGTSVYLPFLVKADQASLPASDLHRAFREGSCKDHSPSAELHLLTFLFPTWAIQQPILRVAEFICPRNALVRPQYEQRKVTIAT